MVEQGRRQFVQQTRRAKQSSSLGWCLGVWRLFFLCLYNWPFGLSFLWEEFPSLLGSFPQSFSLSSPNCQGEVVLKPQSDPGIIVLHFKSLYLPGPVVNCLMYIKTSTSPHKNVNILVNLGLISHVFFFFPKWNLDSFVICRLLNIFILYSLPMSLMQQALKV